MDEQLLIQEIHRSFDFDLMEAMRGLNRESLLHTVKPRQMADPQFLKIADHYRQYYPQNNFVTERQVEQICKKYNLVMGPTMLFTGDVPLRNRQEIARFRLRDADRIHADDNTLRQFLFEKLRGADRQVYTGESHHSKARFVAETPYFEQNSDDMNQVLPIGDGFILVADPERDGDYRLFAKIDVYGSEWIVDCGRVSVWTGRVRIDWQYGMNFRVNRRATINRACRVRLELFLDELEGLNRLDLSHNVSPHIVAPGTMFEKYSDAVHTANGYRLRFKETPASSGGIFRFFLNDPIVLQPVPGGYLVVTKWGLESSIPEIQNPGTN